MQIAPLYVGDTSYIDFVYNVSVFFLFHEEKAESVEKLMIASGMLTEKALADHLKRLCSDEHLHVVQMKREVLGMEGWEIGESGGISDLIFGANDGLVSILALVAGVYGAVAVSQLILVTGISGAIIMLRPIPTSDK